MTGRAVPVLGALVLLAACGKPPQPAPTAPPGQLGAPSPGAPSPGTSSGGTPDPGAPGAVPSFALPPTAPGVAPNPAYPTYALPQYTVPPAPAVTTPPAPAPTGPKPAPACTSGPTAAQVITLARTAPGIPPGLPMTVAGGPYCQSSWQYTKINTKAGEDPLLIVSTGAPAALKLVEAGQDVCSDKVASSAPAGIRVLACGS